MKIRSETALLCRPYVLASEHYDSLSTFDSEKWEQVVERDGP